MKAFERGCLDASTAAAAEEEDAFDLLERVDVFAGGGGSSWAS